MNLFDEVIKEMGKINKVLYGVNPYEEKPWHTEIGQCTSSCRRVGCPEEQSDKDELRGRYGI